MQNFLLAAIISGIVLSSCGGEHKTDIFLARSYFDSIKNELNAGKKMQQNAKATFNNKYPVDADGVAKTDPDFEYENLADFKYTEANINPGEEILILSYSGGDDCDGKTIYYKQFIGIAKSTGDTVRILTPCQIYDGEKAHRTGHYQTDFTAGVIDHTGKKSLVVFNKNQPFLEKKDLKTTIGMLGFEN